jgi:hypothetical protein
VHREIRNLIAAIGFHRGERVAKASLDQSRDFFSMIYDTIAFDTSLERCFGERRAGKCFCVFLELSFGIDSQTYNSSSSIKCVLVSCTLSCDVRRHRRWTEARRFSIRLSTSERS